MNDSVQFHEDKIMLSDSLKLLSCDLKTMGKYLYKNSKKKWLIIF